VKRNQGAVLIEDLTEVDDALMERYLEGEELGAEELAAALKQGILGKNFVPVLVCSGILNRGIQPILDIIADACPSPAELPAIAGSLLRVMSCPGPVPGRAFLRIRIKTLADPLQADFSCFVFSRKLSRIRTSEREPRVKERFSGFTMQEAPKPLESAQPATCCGGQTERDSYR
jgi:elongation factor G